MSGGHTKFISALSELVEWKVLVSDEYESLQRQNAELLAALNGYVSTIASCGGGDKDLFMAAIREADNKARAAISIAEVAKT